MITIRPSLQSDVLLFLRCYEDWPADQYGRYTFDRAQHESRSAAYENERVVAPLTAETNWTQTLVVLQDGEPIGLNRAQATGTTVTVLNQAFVPEWRGKRLFAELQKVLQDYAFKELGADEAVFSIMKHAIGALAHVRNRGQYEQTADGRLHEGRLTRAAWEKATK